MNIRYPIYEGVYRILTKEIRSGNVTLTQEESNMKLTLTVRQKGKTSIDIEQ